MRPATPSQLAKLHPAADLIRGGHKVRLIPYGRTASRRSYFKFKATGGFVELEINGEKTTVHKDQLYFLLRAAGNPTV